MKKLALSLATLFVAGTLAACGSAKNAASPTGTGTPTPVNPTPTPTNTGNPTPTPPPTGLTTITKIHQTPPATGSVLSLAGIVVTAVDAKGDFYAQDAAGGPWTGCYFYNKNHISPANLAVGDTVSLTGTYSPYSGPSSSPWPAPYIETEVEPTVMSVTATGATPVSTAIDGTNLALLSCSSATACPAAQYEGVLVNITGAPSINAVDVGNDLFNLTDNATSTLLDVDTVLFDAFEGAMVGDTVNTLAGVVSNNYKAFKIAPRSAADIVFATGTTVATANSYTSINALLNDFSLASGQLVTITGGSGIYVDGVAPYKSGTRTQTNFWAMDGTTGASQTGIYFADPYYKIPSLTVGNNIASLTGKYVFYNASQSFGIITGFSDTGAVAGTGTAGLTAMSIPLSEATVNGSGAQQYEGVLVMINDAGMTVQKAPNSYHEYEVGTDATSNFVWVGAQTVNTAAGKVMTPTPTAITSVQGPIHFSFGNTYVEPQTMADVQ